MPITDLPAFLTDTELAGCPVFYRFLTVVPVQRMAELEQHPTHECRRLQSRARHSGEDYKPLSTLMVDRYERRMV